MSRVLIQSYLNQLADLRKFSGTDRESVVSDAFKDLLKGWARGQDLTFIPEYALETPAREQRRVDGALVDSLRIPFGYWEAKDQKDDLDAEIDYKISRGYPQDNIIFEDSTQAVLIQNRQEVIRSPIDDTGRLERLLNLFFGFERAEISEFRRAVEQFKTDLPAVLDRLREMIGKVYAANDVFRRAADEFLTHAREAINPSLTEADVREMLIQHILTEEIFSKVFGEDDFHRQNNVAKKLYELEETFFTGDLKKRTLRGLDAYYTAIKAAAARIGSHHEKQAFLKTIYENFYKVYNPKAADRLGVVYTPGEIVRFMIEGADWLCDRHFGRNLIDRDVEILDPAAGTGTFICDLIEHFRGQPGKLKHKYLEELHANEVAILPYYVANLNIESTYAAITGEYLEYPNLCFVDTLDNTYGLRKYRGHIDDLFGSVSAENVARIRRQNRRRISVVIGNPPYNANQLNENENNKNREYPEIDKRIKETYIKASTAQKTKLYDMYARFFRWASDRVDENGIVAFVSNRSFIDSRTFDGFRAVVEKEFNEIRIVDLGGDVRANPKLSGTKNNVFGIQTGVTVSFLVKKKGAKGCRIFYARRPEMETAEEKLAFLGGSRASELAAEEIRPDAKHNWINLTSNDFDTLIPIASKETKAAKKPSQEKAIFKLFSLGVSTSRDDWVYGQSETEVRRKTAYLVDVYNADLERLHSPNKKIDAADLNYEMKWTRAVKHDLAQGLRYDKTAGQVVPAAYRPFCPLLLHFNGRLIEVQYQQTKLFGDTGLSPNRCITFTDAGSQKDFMCLVVDRVFDYHYVGAAAAAVGVPLSRCVEDRIEDNITDWALEQFRKHYQPGRGRKAAPINKEDIFHYVYAVLHDPAYREKYAQNLKREFPRIPFYPDFRTWAAWGRELMELHIGYESVEPFPLTRSNGVAPDEDLPARAQRSEHGGEVASDRTPAKGTPKALLKADKERGRIILDSRTTLAGIPPEAWDYRLGNRSALEWVLDQYKEKKPKDPTIRAKFNTYRFADYKEKVIDLLARVTTVSVRTQAIVSAMKDTPH